MDEHEVFDDSPEYRPAPSLVGRLNAVPRSVWGGSALVIVLLAAVPWLFGFARFQSDYHVRLHGPGVDHLEVGAPVALGIQRIGQVTSVETHEGRITADLTIRRTHAMELPTETVFMVASLNDWLPGNVGVRVFVPETGHSFERLADGSLIHTPEQLLPIEIPPRFYLLIAVAVGLIIVVLVIAGLLRDWIRGVVMVLITLAIIAVAFLCLSRVISPTSLDISPAEFIPKLN